MYCERLLYFFFAQSKLNTQSERGASFVWTEHHVQQQRAQLCPFAAAPSVAVLKFVRLCCRVRIRVGGNTGKRIRVLESDVPICAGSDRPLQAGVRNRRLCFLTRFPPRTLASRRRE